MRLRFALLALAALASPGLAERHARGVLEPSEEQVDGTLADNLPPGVRVEDVMDSPERWHGAEASARARTGTAALEEASRLLKLSPESRRAGHKAMWGTTGATGVSGFASSDEIDGVPNDVRFEFRRAMEAAQEAVEQSARRHEAVVPPAVAAKREYVFPYVAELTAAEARVDVARKTYQRLLGRRAALERHVAVLKLAAEPEAHSSDAAFIDALRRRVAKRDELEAEARRLGDTADVQARMVEMGVIAVGAARAEAEGMAADANADPEAVRRAEDRVAELEAEAAEGHAAASAALAAVARARRSAHEAGLRAAQFHRARQEAIREAEAALAALAPQTRAAKRLLEDAEAAAGGAEHKAAALQEARLVEENEDLHEQVEAMRAQSGADAELQSENERLRKQNAALLATLEATRDSKDQLLALRRANARRQLLHTAFDAALSELRAIRERMAARQARTAFRRASSQQLRHMTHRPAEGPEEAAAARLAAEEAAGEERKVLAELRRLAKALDSMDASENVSHALRVAAQEAREAEIDSVRRRATALSARREADRYALYMRRKMLGEDTGDAPEGVKEAEEKAAAEEEEAARKRAEAEARARELEAAAAAAAEEEAKARAREEAELEQLAAEKAEAGAGEGDGGATGGATGGAGGGAEGSDAPAGAEEMGKETPVLTDEEKLEQALAEAEAKAEAEAERQRQENLEAILEGDEASEAGGEEAAAGGDGAAPTLPSEAEKAGELVEAEADALGGDEEAALPPIGLPEIPYVPDPRGDGGATAQDKPTQADKPTQPTKPTKPTNPTKPAQPAQPAKPTQPTKPSAAEDCACAKHDTVATCGCAGPRTAPACDPRAGAACILPASPTGVTGVAAGADASPHVVSSARGLRGHQSSGHVFTRRASVAGPALTHEARPTAVRGLRAGDEGGQRKASPTATPASVPARRAHSTAEKRPAPRAASRASVADEVVEAEETLPPTGRGAVLKTRVADAGIGAESAPELSTAAEGFAPEIVTRIEA